MTPDPAYDRAVAATAHDAEGARRAHVHDYGDPCDCDPHWDERPTPTPPAGEDVERVARERVMHVLDSHGIDSYFDGEGQEVGVENMVTDILAALSARPVEAGEVAARAWDEGHRVGWEHCQDGNYGNDYWDDDTPNPYATQSASAPSPVEAGEVERLRGWKAQALPVMSGLQDLGRALGVRLGESITGEAAAEKARALARATAAEERIEKVRALIEDAPREPHQIEPQYTPVVAVASIRALLDAKGDEG